jgi:hypothetical protein
VLLCILAAPTTVQAAERIEPVDAEFLEYLADLEGSQEDWTLFAEDEPKPVKARPDKDPKKADPDSAKAPAAAANE